MKKLSLEYIAGFFDGEGCATLDIRRTKTNRFGYQIRPIISITQKNNQILYQIKSTLDAGGEIKGMVLRYRAKSSILKFIRKLRPHVRLKQKQLDIVKKATRLMGVKVKTKEEYMKLLGYVKKIWALNGKRSHKYDIDKIKQEIINSEKWLARERISREELNNLYWNYEMSEKLIAKRVKLGHSTIHKLFVEYNIPRRNPSEALKVAYRVGRHK